MKIFDLFSKRRKRELAEVPDIFVYDEFPESLRVQILHIWADVAGRESARYNNNYQLYELAHQTIRSECS
ncbi:MAG TPA: hypothetical protein VGC97_22885, partial [Pyrinomonadaceae bacterium]